MDLIKIENKIYEIRGQRVMLDRDLAELYGVETKTLNQTVKRNAKRFEGDDFMFRLTTDEFSRSQIVTLNKGRGSNMKYMPYAFTELGVSMLSSVLRSDAAIEINRNIMRAFVAIRHAVLAPPTTDKVELLAQELRELKTYMNEVLTDQNEINEDTRIQLHLINETLANLQAQPVTPLPRRAIGYTATLERYEEQMREEKKVTKS